jgi:carboxypeptidase C (cathepsin A)
MFSKLTAFCGLFLLPSIYGYTQEALADQIQSLPNYPDPMEFNAFSGYLPVSDTKNIFYMYFESKQSTQDTDPVVFWTNGGPGCSGMLGAFTEQGPFTPLADGSLGDNAYSWNNVANMLFVEQPAGVGFSYSSEPKGGDYTTGDDQAAVDNRELILQFLKRFPEVQENEFYISSESYGGHYMPQLAKEIVDHNDDGAINFKGLAVGNPYTNAFQNTVAQYTAYYHRGVVPAPIFNEWEASCTQEQQANTTKCVVLEGKMMRKMGHSINPYALDYPVCAADEASSEALTLMNFVHPEEVTSQLKDSATYEPCMENYLIDYLNRDDVKTAIHAKSDIKWGSCSNVLDYSHEDGQRDTSPLYNELLEGNHGLNILVYSGDDDAICAMTGTDNWIWNLGFKVDEDNYWNQLTINEQTAGYTTKFVVNEKMGSFNYATVHGAGHVSKPQPQTQPITNL